MIDEGVVVLGQAVSLSPCLDGEVTRDTGDGTEQCSGQEGDRVQLGGRATSGLPLADDCELRGLSRPYYQRTEVLLGESGDVGQAGMSRMPRSRRVPPASIASVPTARVYAA